MKVRLLHKDRDFDLTQRPPWNERSLRDDLALDVVLSAMGGKDRAIREIAQKVLLSGSKNDVETVLYRQDVLRDVIANPAAVRQLHTLAHQTLEGKRGRAWGMWTRRPSPALYTAVDVMDLFAEQLRRLRDMARELGPRFRSQGFTTLFALLDGELADSYLDEIKEHLAVLKFREGALVTARLGAGNRGEAYVLRRTHKDERPWIRRLLDREPSSMTYHLPERDEAGARALSNIRDRSIFDVATALTRSVGHVTAFFETLRRELAFYLGCLNLHDRLAAIGEPICFPRPSPAASRRLAFSGLCDVSLGLQSNQRVVGNSADADGKDVLVITGANRGGKSSLLRAMGLAQVMSQAGLFVAADSYSGALSAGIATHYKREEDAGMKRGKLDEELSRMSEIADHLRPGAMLFCNESFASTNEREGSEIARQLVTALADRGVRVLFVTHLYTFARGLYDHRTERMLFLHAERLPDGQRTFRVLPGEPLATSHGQDLYARVFA